MSMTKNVPGWERVVRVVLGLAVAAACGFWAAGGHGVVGLVGAAMGLGLAASGLIGWCPLCAMVGRTLPKTERLVKIAKL